MADSQIDEIKNRLNIVDVVQGYIKLYKAGANYRANCPFHSEKKPSFFVSPARQIWHCFGSCGEGGDIFKFVMKVEGVEFGDALRILAEKAGVELTRQDPKLKTERQRLFEISELACRFFEKQLEESAAGKEVKGYLSGRGIKEETIKNWRIGYSPDSWRSLSDFLVGQGYKREEVANAGLALKSERGGDFYDRFRGRIMFPIFNLSSKPIGFGGRVFKNLKRPDGQDEAKYINTPNTLIYDKSRVLYGLNKAGMEARKKDFCMLVEGYVDAIMVSQAGFENVAATSGTALTIYQLEILKRYSDNLFTAFDMDIAGDSATKRGIDLAQTAGFNIKIVTTPENPETPGVAFKDPADVVAKDPLLWEQRVKNAKTIHNFYFENTLAKFDKNTVEGKKQISKVLMPVIKKIPNKIEQELWIQDLAKVLKIKEENIEDELKKVKITGSELERRIDQTLKPKEESLKSRKEMLEDYLSVVAFKNPGIIDLVKTEDINIFSPKFISVMDYLKNNNPPIEESQKELQDLINQISLKAEILELDPGFDLEAEFSNCFREIKMIDVKNRLDEISCNIKKAEEENNFAAVDILAKEFDSFSKKRAELEAS